MRLNILGDTEFLEDLHKLKKLIYKGLAWVGDFSTHLSIYIKGLLELYNDYLKDTMVYRKRDTERGEACFANTSFGLRLNTRTRI